MFSEFTHHDQLIPSPWGMPAFEKVNDVNHADLFVDYEKVTSEFESTPCFTGQRVDMYIELRNMAKLLGHMSRAFPPGASAEESDCFEQCPTRLNIDRLTSFLGMCCSDYGQELFKHAKTFQSRTTESWNPKLKDTTLSYYLGLVGIDEAASKE